MYLLKELKPDDERKLEEQFKFKWCIEIENCS